MLQSLYQRYNGMARCAEYLIALNSHLGRSFFHCDLILSLLSQYHLKFQTFSVDLKNRIVVSVEVPTTSQHETRPAPANRSLKLGSWKV